MIDLSKAIDYAATGLASHDSLATVMPRHRRAAEDIVHAALVPILEALAEEAQREHHEAWQEYDNVPDKRSHEAGLAHARRTETLDANWWLRRKLRELKEGQS